MAGLWEPVSGVYWRTPPTVPDEGWPLSAVIVCALVAAFLAVAVVKRIAQKFKPEGWHLREHLGEIGGALTLTYLVIVVVVTWGRVDTLMTMPLNEVGDFLAGAFGPVAFLWLVFGFLQQGDELRQGTKALELQASELKNSVEQQSIMARAASEQIESQRRSLQLQIEDREKSLQANFSIQTTPTPIETEEGTLRFGFSVTNDGNDAYKVHVDFNPPVMGATNINLGTIKATDLRSFRVTFPISGDGVKGGCNVRYEDSVGNTRIQRFDYACLPPGFHVRVEKIREIPLAPPYFVTAELGGTDD